MKTVEFFLLKFQVFVKMFRIHKKIDKNSTNPFTGLKI